MENKRNIPKALIGFLIASFLIWMLINLSKEYTSVVSYNVDYGAVPQNMLLQKQPLESIDLLLKGSGFRLFSEAISKRKIQFEISKMRQKKDTDFYLLPNNQLVEIQDQLPSGLNLQEVLQDTIRLTIGRLASKKIPVITDLKIKFKPGYNLSEELKIKPDSITISGSKNQLKNIQEITISNVNIAAISDDFSKEISLNLFKKYTSIKYSAKKVTISGAVDKFTEGFFEIPYTVENVPLKTDLKTFPKLLKVTYKVGLKNFSNVTKESFEIVCDLKYALNNNLSYLTPKVKTKPAIVSSVKIAPSKVEFLIHK